MTLAAYLAREQLSAAGLARRLGVSRGCISLILLGKNQAGLGLAWRIQAVTGGAVQVADVRPRLDARPGPADRAAAAAVPAAV